MTLRRVNVVILILLAVAFLILVQRNLLNLSDFLHKESADAGMVLPFEAELSPDQVQDLERKGEEIPVLITASDQVQDLERKGEEIPVLITASDQVQDLERKGEEIPVLITASEDRLGAVIAAINSVYQNSKANVVFTIVTMNDTTDHLRTWLSQTKLKNVKHKIIIFNQELLSGKIPKDLKTTETSKPLTFARFYLPLFIPEAEKAIYLDDDIIVQGDIQELFKANLKPGHAAAFSEDCDPASSKGIVRGAGNQNNYIGFLDFKKESIKKLGMRANTCSFNPGVIIANLTEWRNQNITQQLEHWMERNAQEDLYSKTLAESVTTPPLLIVFYKHHSSINPLWHVRHLGTTGAGNRYSSQFVKTAKLLHWNGHYKPWGRASSFSDVWEKWFIPDPTGKFHPVRRHSD